MTETKGINPIVSAVFILAITIVGIGLVMNIGMPAIEEARGNTVFDNSRQNLQILDNTIENVRHGGEGTSRTMTLNVDGGEYYINESENTVRFKYDMRTGFLPPDLCRRDGNILIKTFGDGRTLDLRFNEGEGDETMDCSRYENSGTIHGANWTETEYGPGLNFTEDDTVNVTDFRQDLETVSIWFKVDDDWNHSIDDDRLYSISGENISLGIFDEDISNVVISSFRIYDSLLTDEEIETLANRGSIREARELDIRLSPEHVNLTNSLRMGTGKHTILVRNSGHEDGKTLMEIERI